MESSKTSLMLLPLIFPDYGSGHPALRFAEVCRQVLYEQVGTHRFWHHVRVPGAQRARSELPAHRHQTGQCAIVGHAVLVPFFTWFSLREAVRNDKRTPRVNPYRARRDSGKKF